MSRLLVFQGSLYTVIAALTPLSSELASDEPLTPRKVFCLAVGSIVAGATALKAFLSTTFSESSASIPENHDVAAGRVVLPASPAPKAQFTPSA